MLRALARSTPFRLTVLLGCAFLAALVIAGGLALYLVQRDLDRRTDQAIASTFAVIAQSYGENDVTDMADTVTSHANASPDESQLFLLRDPGGAVLAGNVQQADVAPGWSNAESQAFGLPAGGNRYRAYLGQVGGYSLLVATSFAESRAIAGLVMTSLAWAGVLFGALLLALGLFVAVRAQRRLDTIATTMQQVGHGNLDARIPVGDRRDDIGDLSRQVNAALDRLTALVEGMRQVSVDIAHDLKTPLNRLSITVENAIASDESGEPVGQLLLQAEEESRQINRTFDALLRIAQLESGARRARFVALQLAPILRTIEELYAEVAEEAGQRLTLGIANDLPVISGDRELLVQLIANLVENAIRHCPSGAEITIEARRDGRDLLLSVADTGPGIPPEERDRVFQRLYRLEKSRTTPGSGLGLSLVKAIADLHGAPIVLEDNAPGLRVTLRFPPRN
ncbi:MAG: two-component sensor histidine kinase [Devosia sp.]|uniref:sensor histidine kinase n=1 Tax=Devosia sp. TaxID=1871048 RepID=UPI00262649F0|nr:ATP-binding protein [Devosia sp.]MDB5541442.1 two-component sensor histidine kinase [Devosia sp.]